MVSSGFPSSGAVVDPLFAAVLFFVAVGRRQVIHVREFRQFTLPMALHRLCAKSGVVRKVEEGMRKTKITSMFGNPVLIRFDRKQA